jgi:hypothetical protein
MFFTQFGTQMNFIEALVLHFLRIDAFLLFKNQTKENLVAVESGYGKRAIHDIIKLYTMNVRWYLYVVYYECRNKKQVYDCYICVNGVFYTKRRFQDIITVLSCD